MILVHVITLLLSSSFILGWFDREKIKNFTSGKGFEINEGSVSFFFLKDCLTYNLKTCFALNADAPYGLFHLPPNPAEPQYRGCVNKTEICGNGCNPKNDPFLYNGVCKKDMPMQWRLTPEEVVLILGTSPPECSYWSITHYLMSSFYEKEARISEATFSSLSQKMAVSCKDGPQRCAKFGSLSQPYNIMRFQNGSVIQHEKPLAAVMSTNKQMTEEIAAFLSSNFGIEPYLLKIPSDLLNMGVENDTKDMFTILMRVAYPANKTAMDSYFSNPPLTVFRITPKAQKTTNPTLYKQTDSYFIPRNNTNKEGDSFASNVSHDSLLAALDELRDKIVTAHQSANPNFKTYYESSFLKPFFIDGLDCVKDGTECNGDSPDTLYPISNNIYISEFCDKFPVLGLSVAITVIIPVVSIVLLLVFRNKITMRFKIIILALVALYIIIASIVTASIWRNSCHSGNGSRMHKDQIDTYVVFGANHEKLNWSRYASVTAYHYEKLSGIHSCSSKKEYINSAELYLGKNHPLAPYLFAYRYARNCTNSNLGVDDNFCYNVPYDGVGQLPEDGKIFFMERMYVNPKTLTGPSYSDSIPARLLQFR
jgi:hypothetical protein